MWGPEGEEVEGESEPLVVVGVGVEHMEIVRARNVAVVVVVVVMVVLVGPGDVGLRLGLLIGNQVSCQVSLMMLLNPNRRLRMPVYRN